MLINGKELASEIRAKVKQEIKALGLSPGMAAILVGDDSASLLYVSLKERACAEVGIKFEKHLLPAEVKEITIINLIRALNKRADINGILVQLPLPPHLNPDKLIAEISPLKDVDGFHPENLKAFLAGKASIVPNIVKSVMALIDATGETLEGKHAALVVNSATFAEPLVHALKTHGARVHVFYGDDPHLAKELPHSDVLIVAIGRPKFIETIWIKRGAIVIDIGINKVDGKAVGDVDFERAKEVASWITPVPGGVGPVTVATLLQNVMKAAEREGTNG